MKIIQGDAKVLVTKKLRFYHVGLFDCYSTGKGGIIISGGMHQLRFWDFFAA